MKKYHYSNFRLITLAILAMISGHLCSCTRTVYVPLQNETVRTDTLMHTVHRHDTILLRDSVTTLIKGDTMIRTIVRDRTHTRILHDTLYRTLHDTIIRQTLPAAINRQTFLPSSSSTTQKPAARIFTLLVALAALAAYIAFRHLKKLKS